MCGGWWPTRRCWAPRFPAEALIAVSGRDEPAVRAALAELVRREVLTVSADPLSPERGSYGFAQNMLRQVAYDTLSRRDRKARHLTVAAHLRAAFPGDGEEVADVIARHYLDALDAVPGDRDADQIRGQAIAALIRAAERAERTGAPALAAASYATAAELTSSDTGRTGTADGQHTAGVLWERAAQAAATSGDWAAAIEHAGRAREYHLGHGQAGRLPGPRPSPGVRCAVGAVRRGARSAHRRGGGAAGRTRHRHGARPGTARGVEVFAGSPDADWLSAEALILGQDLGVGTGQLAGLLADPRDLPEQAERRPQAVAYFREAARLATQDGDNLPVGRALLNLADALAATDPAAAAEAARTAAGQLRRTGARGHLASAVMNLAQALLMLGDWDTAEAELTQAVDADGLAEHEYFACFRGWLAALRGDTATAETMLAGLQDLRASEDPQDKAMISLVEAFTAAARHQPQDALRHARGTLAHADALGISHELHALGVAAGRPRRPRPAGHRRHRRTARPARLLPARAPGPHACGPNATWPAPASPAATATRPPPRPSPPRSAACAS